AVPASSAISCNAALRWSSERLSQSSSNSWLSVATPPVPSVKESADSKTLSAVPFRPSALSSASSKPLTIPVTSEAALSSAPARSCMRPGMLLASESIVLAVSGSPDVLSLSSASPSLSCVEPSEASAVPAASCEAPSDKSYAPSVSASKPTTRSPAPEWALSVPSESSWAPSAASVSASAISLKPTVTWFRNSSPTCCDTVVRTVSPTVAAMLPTIILEASLVVMVSCDLAASKGSSSPKDAAEAEKSSGIVKIARMSPSSRAVSAALCDIVSHAKPSSESNNSSVRSSPRVSSSSSMVAGGASLTSSADMVSSEPVGSLTDHTRRMALINGIKASAVRIIINWTLGLSRDIDELLDRLLATHYFYGCKTYICKSIGYAGECQLAGIQSQTL